MDSVRIAADESHPLEHGADVIVVSAKDKAGNVSTAKFLLD